MTRFGRQNDRRRRQRIRRLQVLRRARIRRRAHALQDLAQRREALRVVRGEVVLARLRRGVTED